MGNKTHIANGHSSPLSGNQTSSPQSSLTQTQRNMFPLSSELPPQRIDDDEINQDECPTLSYASSSDFTGSMSIDPDMTNPSMSTSLLAIKERHAFSLSRRKKSLLAIIALLLIAAPIVAAIGLLTISGESPLQEAQEQSNKISSESTITGLASSETSLLEANNQEIVQIQFTNLPQDAVVHFNQKPVMMPIQIQKSSTPQFLEVIKDGEKLFSTSLIPAKDLFIEIPLMKAQMTKHRNVKKRRTRVPGASQKKSRLKSRPKLPHGNLSSNPFPLKSNPFATGE